MNDEFDAWDIQRLRESLGMSNEMLAAFVGAGPATVRNWQRTTGPSPAGLHLTLLNAIAAAFKRDKVATVMAVSMSTQHHGISLLRVLQLAFPEETDVVTVETTKGPVRIDLAKLKGFEVKNPLKGFEVKNPVKP